MAKKKRTKAQRRASALAYWAAKKAAMRGNQPVAAPTKTKYSSALLNEREATHGDYGVNAGISQGIKNVFHSVPEYGKLDASQKESAELIATKFGRIVAGNPNFAEHWKDIAGYANLQAERLTAAKSAKK